jgi:hypothetical protein
MLLSAISDDKVPRSARDHSWLWQVENTFLSAAIHDPLAHVNLYGPAGCVSNAVSLGARIGQEIGAATCHNYL